jgi:hypothetical protein
MTSEQLVIGPRSAEIVAGDVSGGPNTSHTILVAALAALLEALPPAATIADYERAAVEGNVLGKQTEGARRRTFRYLKELYLLRPDALLFRAMRDLWPDDANARPLLAGLCALARDAVFRASSAPIIRSGTGDTLTARELADAVGERFSASYNESTLAKIGRNTFSSWEQTGHLAPGERMGKRRIQATCRPANVAYALMLGYVEGARGEALFETIWAQVLDHPKSQLLELAFAASQRGLVEFRYAGGVVDLGFRGLLRPFQEDPT